MGMIYDKSESRSRWTLGKYVVTQNDEGVVIAYDGIERQATLREWQDIYLVEYEIHLRDSAMGQRLRSLIYPGRKNVVISRNKSTPTLDEKDAEEFLLKTYGTPAFTCEVALYFILLYWYEPERLPWNAAKT